MTRMFVTALDLQPTDRIVADSGDMHIVYNPYNKGMTLPNDWN